MKEKKRVALLSVFAAVFLTLFKFVVGMLTGSLGILSEALHSGMDLIAALVTFFSVRISDKPADNNHPYGHGKIENLSALIETLLLVITCAWIIYESVDRLATGHAALEVTFWSYAVVVTSIVVDISRSRVLSRAAKKHNSQALEADALHFSTDIWSSAVVLLGLVVAQFGWQRADAIAALCVAVIVLTVSYRLGKKSIQVLLDQAPKDTVLLVEQLLDTYPNVTMYHSLKVRTAGPDTFIKVNIHLNPELNLRQVHQVCDALEKDLTERIPRCEVYIHAEPHESGCELEKDPDNPAV